MTRLDRRTRCVLDTAQALLELRPEGIMPADLIARSQRDGDPLAAWEVRGALSELERAGLLTMNPQDCSWRGSDAGLEAGVGSQA